MYDKLPQLFHWCDKEKKNYINGEFLIGKGSSFSCEDPCSEENISQYNFASTEQIDSAVKAAQECFVKLKQATRSERNSWMMNIARTIREHTPELAAIEALENGKTYQEALNDDLPECSTVFEYYGGWIDKIYGETCPTDPGFLNYTVREPYGVCGLIVPWNYPLLMACWKLAPALALGNTVLVKPSEHTSLSMIRLIELLDEHCDLPKGLINMILGDGKQGAHICEHPLIQKVSFTGSTDVGKNIVKASGKTNLKGVSLELGGKSPNIFFNDTPDLDSALTKSFYSMFSHKGEKCTEPTRFIIHKDIYKHSCEFLAKMAQEYKLGSQFEKSSQQGAQNNRTQFDKIMGFIERADANLIAGGKAAKYVNGGKGYFIEPTIYSDVDPKSELAQKEIFGPVLSIIPFNTESEAIEIANDSDFGLAAGFWTADSSRVHRVAAQIDAGMVFVNKYGMYSLGSPFGGFRQSGWGKEMAIHSLDTYSKTKSVWIKYDT